jgi:hypothetical protein
VIQERKAAIEIKTTTKVTPHPKVTVVPNCDVKLTWLLQHINDGSQFNFHIDRTKKSCRTPRRNDEIEGALAHFTQFNHWAGCVNAYMQSLFAKQTPHDLNLGVINAQSILVPVVPLLEARGAPGAGADAATQSSACLIAVVPPFTPGAPVTLPVSDITGFLAEQKRAFKEKHTELLQALPDNGKLITFFEGAISVLALHTCNISTCYSDGINYIESMLRKQLIAAIGKEVTPVDFANFMRFHNRKLFKTEYEPRLFCQAIRRPDHYPEGSVSIEQTLSDGSQAEPVTTQVRLVQPAAPMNFALDAATNVTFHGERFLHAYVAQKFSNDTGSSLNLVARARQFSSFILMVGRIASGTVFEPKGAIIIQNKDDLKIPLMLEALPTPKEFKDAIVSLSPEQQAFCKAYRAMQLESTLFGIVVLQIKPQLEKLLKLPDDSLTKEIRLTQDLFELFQRYQIPSDLLTYDGPEAASVEIKLSAVKEHVANMQSMITGKKEEEIQQVVMENAYISPPTLDYDEGEMLCESAAPSFDIMMEQTVQYSSGPVPIRDMDLVSVGSLSIAPPANKRTAAPKKREKSVAPKPTSAATATTTASKPQSTSAPKQVTSVQTGERSGVEGDDVLEVLDYTKIPAELDKKFEALDEDSALRPTIINIGEHWTKTSYPSLLAGSSVTTLSADEQKQEQNKAFDLIDALSRSGSLSFDYAELHVVIAATHCFDKTLMDTVVIDNVNPIEKVERSSLIIASTIQNQEPQDLIKVEHVERAKKASPKLFGEQPIHPALESLPSIPHGTSSAALKLFVQSSTPKK